MHGVAEQQPLGTDAGDVVHEEVLPGEEVLQATAQPAARRHAALVELVQMPHHCRPARAQHGDIIIKTTMKPQ